jgi:hypothetical protein
MSACEEFTIGLQSGSKAILGFYTVSLKNLFSRLALVIEQCRALQGFPEKMLNVRLPILLYISSFISILVR